MSTLKTIIVMVIYFSFFCSVSYAVKADDYSMPKADDYTAPEAVEFLNLPITFIYPNGVEALTDVTINEMIRLGINDSATKTWEQLEPNKRILTITLKDSFSGKTTIIKILFTKITSPNRVLFDRAIINGKELTVMETYGLYKELVLPVFAKKHGR